MGPLLAGDNLIGAKRVPLHPEDAAKFTEQHNAALTADDQRRSEAFAAEILRLGALAERKNEYDRMQRGPRDQQLSYSLAVEDIGMPSQRKPTRSFETWATSEPKSRSLLVHLLSVPENFVYQATEALSDQKPLPEVTQRLSSAIPGAVYPPSGFPVEPGRERMYEELGPVSGLAAEMLMPGLDFAAAGRVGSSAARRARGLYGAANKAWKSPVRAELIDNAGDVIRRLRNAQ